MVLMKWGARVLAVLIALSAVANTGASSTAEFAGSLLVFALFVFIVFKATSGGDAGDTDGA